MAYLLGGARGQCRARGLARRLSAGAAHASFDALTLGERADHSMTGVHRRRAGRRSARERRAGQLGARRLVPCARPACSATYSVTMFNVPPEEKSAGGAWAAVAQWRRLQTKLVPLSHPTGKRAVQSSSARRDTGYLFQSYRFPTLEPSRFAEAEQPHAAVPAAVADPRPPTRSV